MGRQGGEQRQGLLGTVAGWHGPWARESEGSTGDGSWSQTSKRQQLPCLELSALRAHTAHTLPRFIVRGHARQCRLYVKAHVALAGLTVGRGLVDRETSPGVRVGAWARAVVEVMKDLRAIGGLEWIGLGPERRTGEGRGKEHARFSTEIRGDGEAIISYTLISIYI